MTSGISSTRPMVPRHLTKLSKMLKGTSCCMPFPMLLRGCWPASKRTGTLSAKAPRYACEGVGGPGARAAHGHADLAGGPGVPVGDLHSLALVTGGEGGDGRRTKGGPQGRQPPAGEAANVLDPFLLQGSDNRIASAHLQPLSTLLARDNTILCRGVRGVKEAHPPTTSVTERVIFRSP